MASRRCGSAAVSIDLIRQPYGIAFEKQTLAGQSVTKHQYPNSLCGGLYSQPDAPGCFRRASSLLSLTNSKGDVGQAYQNGIAAYPSSRMSVLEFIISLESW